MQNALIIGTADTTQRFLDKSPKAFLLVDDRDWNLPTHDTIDHTTRFNILRAAKDDDAFARDFIALLDTIYPEGATTLTRRTENYLLLNVLRLLLLDTRATLLDIPNVLNDVPYRHRLLKRNHDHVVAQNWDFIETWEAKDYRPLIQKITGLLTSPIIRQALCAPKSTFKLPTDRRTVLRLDRAVLGDFTAFLIGTMLMGQYQGQVIVPDFGFYGRDVHIPLIRQDRLIAGVRFLAELPPKLQQAVLTIKDKTAYRTTLADAERLLPYFRKITKPSQITELEDGEYLAS